MTGVWRAGEKVKAVKDQRPPGTRQDGADVMASERAAECDRVQVDRAVAALMRLRGGDVIGPGTLALDAMEIDARTVTRADFGDCVRPVDALLEGGVRLHDRSARFALDHDEVARMRDDLAPARRQEQQLNRLSDRHLRRYVDERTIGDERRVQRGKRTVLKLGVLAQMLADDIRGIG